MRRLAFGCLLALALGGDGVAQVLVELPRFPMTQYSRGFINCWAFGDVDGDGDVDCVGGCSSNEDRLLVNDGVGRFVDQTSVRFPTIAAWYEVRTGGVALADFDRDGDLDVVFGQNGYLSSSLPCRLYTNDGRGFFKDESMRLPAGSRDYQTSIRLLVGDYDRDGDADIIICNMVSLTFWENDGKGYFADTTVTKGRFIDPYPPLNADLVQGDIDGDGDLDLVAATWNAGAADVLINDGQGRFKKETTTRLLPNPPRDLCFAAALGDVDGDADLDLMLAMLDRALLYQNDGKGVFRDVTPNLPKERLLVQRARFADLDLDGDLDLVLSAATTQPSVDNRVYRNDGKGVFVDATDTFWVRRPGPGYASDLGICDVDADGDSDILYAESVVRLFLNTTRHLYAPKVATVGDIYPLAVWGDPGRVALAFLSGGGGSLQVPPFGRLGLDPSSLVLLPFAQVIPSSRVSVLPAAIPNVNALHGLWIWTQGLVFDASTPLASRLTNAFGEVMR